MEPLRHDLQQRGFLTHARARAAKLRFSPRTFINQLHEWLVSRLASQPVTRNPLISSILAGVFGVCLNCAGSSTTRSSAPSSCEGLAPPPGLRRMHGILAAKNVHAGTSGGTNPIASSHTELHFTRLSLSTNAAVHPARVFVIWCQVLRGRPAPNWALAAWGSPSRCFASANVLAVIWQAGCSRSYGA